MARESRPTGATKPQSKLPAMAAGVFVLAIIGLLILRATWNTFFKYVRPGEMLIVIAKDGDPLEPGQILARPGQKGIQEEVLGEGRHFILPIVNEVEIVKCVEVKPGMVGIVSAKTGKEPPPGRILAERGEKGVWREVLPPGRYRLNPHGYTVEMRPAVRIRPGYVGFVTRKVGDAPKGPFAGPGERGMQKDVLQPGIYYLNPYEVSVDEVEIGIDQVSFLEENVIKFPSADAFPIELESTVEWELHPTAVAELIREFGDPQAVEDKVLVPQSKSIGRLAGSRYGAKDFLLGEGREKFQEAFTKELEKVCEAKHLDVHSAFIRHISIPQALRKPIQEAFVSVEKEKTAKYWEETRKSAADLERETALIDQRKKEVEAETGALIAKIKAEAEQEVGKIEAETRQKIAQKQQEIAQLDAKRTLVLGQANATVQRQLGEARASLFALKVAAFGGDAEAFRRYAFAQALPADFSMRLVESGPGTFWTDLEKTVGGGGVDELLRRRLLQESGAGAGAAPGK